MMRVRVALNLHNGLWSVRTRGEDRVWRVTEYRRAVHLVDAVTVVEAGGRDNMFRRNRRTIHAFVEGELRDWTEVPADVVRVTYHPWTKDHFEDATGARVERLAQVWFDSERTMKGVF